MHLKVIRAAALDVMKEHVRAGATLPAYRGATAFEIDDRELLPSSLEVPDQMPELAVPTAKFEKAASDVDNAIKVHQYLGSIKEIQARDPRLWAYVTHALFPTYCRERWPLPKDDKKAIDSVLTHWFVDARGLAALRRNAIARLWWAAHLTHAPWKSDEELTFLAQDDEYAYTRALLANQDIFQGALERSFGSNQRMLIALLEVVRKDPKNRQTTPFSTAFAKEVNLLSRFRELSVLPPTDLVNAFEEIALRIVRV